MGSFFVPRATSTDDDFGAHNRKLILPSPRTSAPNGILCAKLMTVDSVFGHQCGFDRIRARPTPLASEPATGKNRPGNKRPWRVEKSGRRCPPIRANPRGGSLEVERKVSA